MNYNWIYALFGSIAFSFSTYLLIILQVGHNTKALAISFFPFVSSSGVFFYGAPTPPLTQQQSTDNKVRVNVGLGER